MIPFPAKDGSSEQCLLLEDVSDQDFRWLPQFRLRYRRNRRERKKAARTGKSRMRRNRFDELWNLRFVRIADNPGDAGELAQLLRGALRVASGGDDPSTGI